MDFFVGALLIAVVKRVDDALAHGHADAVAVVFAKTGGFRNTQTHLFGEVDAFDLRLQRHLEMFLVGRHAPQAVFEGKSALKTTVIRNTAESPKSMARATQPHALC